MNEWVQAILVGGVAFCIFQNFVLGAGLNRLGALIAKRDGK
jgi:hypothetical protein